MGKETPANALVRCCFHAYADNMYAKQIESSPNSVYGTIGSKSNMMPPGVPISAPVNSIDKVAEWKVSPSRPSSSAGEHTEVVLSNGSDSLNENGINISEMKSHSTMETRITKFGQDRVQLKKKASMLIMEAPSGA